MFPSLSVLPALSSHLHNKNNNKFALFTLVFSFCCHLAKQAAPDNMKMSFANIYLSGARCGFMGRSLRTHS